MLNFLKGLLAFFLLFLVAGQVLGFPGKTASDPAPQPAFAADNLTKGAVVETMDAAGYTYVCLESNGQKSWAAIPATKVQLGEEIEISNGMVMQNFTSKSLGRSFDAIIFSQGIFKR